MPNSYVGDVFWMLSGLPLEPDDRSEEGRVALDRNDRSQQGPVMFDQADMAISVHETARRIKEAGFTPELLEGIIRQWRTS